MSRYPGAIWRPLTAKGRDRMVWYRRVNLHVAVSEAPSLFSFFNVKGRADSHFYVRKDGTVEQYVDTDYQAYADLDGNDATISIETQGGLTNAAGEQWTPAQVTALARLYAWAVTTHGVPNKIATDAKIASSSHGLSWHRLGIDGNFPALPSPLAGRKQRGGGMHYSTSAGKVCPGDAKIRQVPAVYAAAQQHITHPTDQEDDDMPISDADAEKIAQKVWRYQLAALEYKGLEIPAQNAGTRLNALAKRTARNEALNAETTIRVRGLGEVGPDAEQVAAAIQRAVDDALADLSITLTTEEK